MGTSDEDKIGELLREGLDHYGADEIGRAIQTWEQVLALDPENAEAKDYLQTADRRSVPRPPSGPAPLKPSSKAEILLDTRERILDQDYEGALGFLSGADAAEQTGLELQAMTELVRSRLLSSYHERVGALASIPELLVDAGKITQFDLPPDAGFVLSLVDGATSVADMISVSGMDPFDALRILQGLLESEIVSMRA